MVKLQPGQEVCVSPAGCGAGVTTNELSSLDVIGPDITPGQPGQQDQPSFSFSTLRQRLLSWVSRSR